MDFDQKKILPEETERIFLLKKMLANLQSNEQYIYQ